MAAMLSSNTKGLKTEAQAGMRAVPLLPKAGLLNEEGRTVAPLKALSKWLCCLASCSRVSSSRILWSLSPCKAFCQRLLWFWARERKSLHALGSMQKQELHFSKRANNNNNNILHIHQQTSNRMTYIDHGIRGDSEQRGPLCDLSDLLPHVPSNTNPLQF